MHAQLEALLLSSLSLSSRVILSPGIGSHSHALHVTLRNNGAIAAPPLHLQLSSTDSSAVAAGILPPPPPATEAGDCAAGVVVAVNDALLQASATAPPRLSSHNVCCCSLASAGAAASPFLHLFSTASPPALPSTPP
jgi:hypothetical protein